jgi:hypothetical protein
VEHVTHAPLVQASLARQAWPQEPQLAWSAARSTHTAPQTGEHAKQAPPAQNSPDAQAWPQEPQLAISALRLVHDVPQRTPPQHRLAPASPPVLASGAGALASTPASPPELLPELPPLLPEPPSEPLLLPELLPESAIVPSTSASLPPDSTTVTSAAASVPEAQVPPKTWLVSIVTAPFRARALPDTLVPVCSAMLVSASMLPTNTVSVPSVAELPICQKARQSWPPLMKTTDALLAVVSLLPIWKMKTALGSPWASRTSVPVSWASEEKQ